MIMHVFTLAGRMKTVNETVEMAGEGRLLGTNGKPSILKQRLSSSGKCVQSSRVCRSPASRPKWRNFPPASSLMFRTLPGVCKSVLAVDGSDTKQVWLRKTDSSDVTAACEHRDSTAHACNLCRKFTLLSSSSDIMAPLTWS